MNYIKINDVAVNTPSRGISIKRSPVIGTKTNAKGEIIAQIINNRNKIEFSALQWNYLTAAEWKVILQEISKITGKITVYDELSAKWLKITVLFGSSSETPYSVDNVTGCPIDYINCQCAVSDMGYAVEEVSTNV